MNLSNQFLFFIFGISVFVSRITWAQTSAPPTHKFEVASVKRNIACAGRRGGGAAPSPGRLNIQCMALQTLIENAYVGFADGVTMSRRTLEISGGPSWIQSDEYDIAARGEGNEPIGQMLGPMMQVLLEERFNLRIHRETKEVAAYFLTVAKGGPKFERTREGSCVIIDLNHLRVSPAPGQPRLNTCGSEAMTAKGSTVTFKSQGTTMELLANGGLARAVGRQIVDKTGLVGLFDIQFEFAPEDMRGSSEFGRVVEPVPSPQFADPAKPTIFEALQQIGLKLEPGKGREEILVVDHVERPSDN